MIAAMMPEDVAMTTMFTSIAGLAPRDGRHDFDFLLGKWAIAHRRLKRRLAGDREWQEFPGVCEARAIVGGLANVDDNAIALPAGAYRASTLRVFDPATAQWSIWWIDGRSPGLRAPVRGRFADGIGVFLGEDAHEGRAILVRFVWSAITERSARWEQAFSADGGASWETNWVMSFARIG